MSINVENRAWDHQHVALVRQEKEKFRGDKDKENLLRMVTESAYSKETHYVLELIQNAEDEDSKNITFTITDDYILVENDGEPFSADDVFSICSAGQTRKENKIGFFGIGFKSVFNITKNPQIISGKYNFSVHEYIYPEPTNHIPDLVTDFEGYDGSGWISLTSGGSIDAVTYDFDDCYNRSVTLSTSYTLCNPGYAVVGMNFVQSATWWPIANLRCCKLKSQGGGGGGGSGDGHSLDAADGDPIDALYVDNDGNVGIGTLIPQVKLDVNGMIRPGRYTTAGRPTCDANTLGAFIFDTTEDRPHTCTAASGGTWKPLDSDYDKDGIVDWQDDDDNNASVMDNELVPGNVANGVDIFGVVGTLEGGAGTISAFCTVNSKALNTGYGIRGWKRVNDITGNVEVRVQGWANGAVYCGPTAWTVNSVSCGGAFYAVYQPANNRTALYTVIGGFTWWGCYLYDPQ